MRDLVWWLLHVAGIDDVSGRWYAFYSGIGSDLGELGAAAAVVGLWWHNYRVKNCHERWCWRIGRLPVEVDGMSYVICERHHPRGAPTHQQMLQAHAAATGRPPAP